MQFPLETMGPHSLKRETIGAMGTVPLAVVAGQEASSPCCDSGQTVFLAPKFHMEDRCYLFGGGFDIISGVTTRRDAMYLVEKTR